MNIRQLPVDLLKVKLIGLLTAAYASVAVLASEPELRRQVDLLVVGGNESAVAAAVQAERLGVSRVLLVNDIQWLGGQFSAEGVGAVDEWTTVAGKRARFPRSGMFLEVARQIEQFNKTRYGSTAPGNCFCAWLTIEPAQAARIFEELVAPGVRSGRLAIERGWEPIGVELDGERVRAVRFERETQRMLVEARMTIDASDWGDVIRLGGASWMAGPDPKSRFGEPSAPLEITEANRREMNPITYCVVLQGATSEVRSEEPEGYDPRRYQGVSQETREEFKRLGWPEGVLRMNAPAFADTTHPGGPYSPPVNVYTHRRLVDAVHGKLPPTQELLFLNWPVQDYPLDVWPRSVANALDRSMPGASLKNLVELTPAQRRIVFDDAKRHALGLLHHLRGIEPRFRSLELTDQFGTADRLPPKPYIREGLRLEALTMVREQDIRADGPEPRWAKQMPTDGVFGYQFNIDFHPTRRQFLQNDPDGPWATIHTSTRNWSTHTDRGMFPLRGLVPVKRDGLLAASKNIGVSSIVSSALRLHGQMMLCGQASATLAWVCLRDGKRPRDVTEDKALIQEIQRVLAHGVGGPGVLLWPYNDLQPENPAFEAGTYLTAIGVWRARTDDLAFAPEVPITRSDWESLLQRIPEELRQGIAAPLPANRAEAAIRVHAALSHPPKP